MQLTSEALSADVAAKLANAQLPPVPPITSLNDALPQESDHIVLGTSAGRLMIWANSDNSDRQEWVPDVPNPNPTAVGVGALLNYWDGGPAAEYTLTMRQFWRQVDSSYTRIPEGNSMSISYTKTYGISTTDSESISAELGVAAGGLSAKVSAAFSHSVTTSQETSETKTISVASPAAGMIRVWVAWQLVDEVVALDRSGNNIGCGDRGSSNRKAEILWVNLPIMPYHSGAWVYYKSVQQTFPSSNVIYAQKDFPAA